MALLDECTVERPIPAFTINGVNPKHCDFAYSFCPPIGIVADGSISTTYGQTVYIWGLCPTEGLDLPCLPDSEIEFKPSMQATHDFGTLDVGTYRLHLRVLSDSFDERKSLDVSICSGNKVPSVSGWGLATMTAVMISAGALLAGRRAKERATPLL
jgi:hypothetical protein